MDLELIKFVPWLPALAAVLCGVCCLRRSLRRAAGPLAVLAVFGSFVLACAAYASVTDGGSIVRAFNWIAVGPFQAGFDYYIDALTMVMLMVVCGVGTLVVLYATGYMAGERGYARFFAGVALFIFAMTSLVMADNLVLLYLGWEGVGLCSYLLIGYYYDRPTAVAAAKKAFIVNRVGDLGFALGIFLTYYTFGTVSLGTPETGVLAQAAARLEAGQLSTATTWIPFLLMLGAFGKSAQLPLHVWLPDAMEGPTPVSALIHAATMVTAGVYMIARLFPIFQLSPHALPTVAIVGGVTALFAATIALCQYDLKRVFAYSTVSQLGYMFLGVGVLSTVGGIFHLFTHAFFKALLFLTAGSVMHAMAGQLDLRKMSGLKEKMPVTCWLMFIGCLALAGFPFTAGFFSKDLILASAVVKWDEDGSPLYLVLAIVGLFTAFLTAFYTFRLWCRVFLGPQRYDMGDEHHGGKEPAEHGEDRHAPHEPHEMPFWPMNAPLVILAIGSVFAGMAGHDWMTRSIEHSSAAANAAAQGEHGGHGIHLAMQLISSVVALAGIGCAFYFHWLRRKAADRIAARFSGIVRLLHHKYYVDELYDLVIVKPLQLAGFALYNIDKFIIQMRIVEGVGHLTRLMGYAVLPTQHGRLQGYALGMVAGLMFIALLVFIAVSK